MSDFFYDPTLWTLQLITLETLGIGTLVAGFFYLGAWLLWEVFNRISRLLEGERR